jgi:nucleotide-binding universal stress UspA family protein
VSCFNGYNPPMFKADLLLCNPEMTMALSTTQPSVDSTNAVVSPPWRDVAVVLTETTGDVAAVEFAAGIARRCGAKLDILQTVVMPTPLIDAWALAPDPGFAQVYINLCDAARARALQLRQQLSSMAVDGEVRMLEALFVEPYALSAEAGRCADVIVIARPCDAPVETALVHTHFSALLLASGRPVLVVPSFDVPLLPASHAMVAWADTAESARALHDALPLLERCKDVDVVLVDAVQSIVDSPEQPGESVARHLRAHGVNARAVGVRSRGRTVGQTLLDHARHSGTQLIVSGGYGHSKVREWVIGGTTRDLFENAQVPVLFSH